ncbi:MAG: pilus assembly protein [Sphingomonadales bacterium]|nr:pilus assembly protein [Sphingomonadales bacterium]MDE2570223.1 pilus assembly protein [Sphingomonadales bacterium]
MKRLASLFARLRASTEGAMVIETAIVTPVLVMMSVGIYDTGRMFERQIFLQSAIGEATAIALAANSGASTDVTTVKSILVQSSGLPANQIAVTKKYRCGTTATLIDDSTTCDPTGEISTYIDVSITDHYTPMWTEFGVGKSIDFRVNRTAQVA